VATKAAIVVAARVRHAQASKALHNICRNSVFPKIVVHIVSAGPESRVVFLAFRVHHVVSHVQVDEKCVDGHKEDVVGVEKKYSQERQWRQKRLDAAKLIVLI
jgi:hypothetical protein